MVGELSWKNLLSWLFKLRSTDRGLSEMAKTPGFHCICRVLSVARGLFMVFTGSCQLQRALPVANGARGLFMVFTGSCQLQRALPVANGHNTCIFMVIYRVLAVARMLQVA